jgi:hypothetical protein
MNSKIINVLKRFGWVPTTLHLSPTGRDRLIAALIEGRNQAIDFHGEGGGGYNLAIEIHPTKF